MYTLVEFVVVDVVVFFIFNLQSITQSKISKAKIKCILCITLDLINFNIIYIINFSSLNNIFGQKKNQITEAFL